MTPSHLVSGCKYKNVIQNCVIRVFVDQDNAYNENVIAHVHILIAKLLESGDRN